MQIQKAAFFEGFYVSHKLIMSFCMNMKNELCAIPLNRCCAISEIYGILLFCNTFNKKEIKVVTENKQLSVLLNDQFIRLFNLQPVTTKRAYKDGIIYTISVTDPQHLHKILWVVGADISPISLSVDHKILVGECCRNAFIRGAFLAGGTISSPEKAYHLEFATSRLRLSQDFLGLLSEYDLKPKITIRKSNRIIYFKDSAAIGDVINIMGAVKSSFEFINEKIVKEIRNDANRITNCETANITKIVEAAALQKKAIKLLTKTGRLEYLDDSIKRVAKLRLDNPTSSLSELTSLSNPPMSKSAINRRLNLLLELSKK